MVLRAAWPRPYDMEVTLRRREHDREHRKSVEGTRFASAVIRDCEV
jgi:hypothetical protein